MSKLVRHCQMIKTVIGDYNFIMFEVVKTVIGDYGFNHLKFFHN